MKLFFGLLLLCILQSSTSMDAIIGSREACSNEGEVVRTDKILNSKCYTCMCRNGFVQCNNKEQCAAVEGCHMVLEMPPDSCCTSKCKGCRHEGVDHESGDEWRDPDNPCRHLQCQAGVITETVEQCYTPCDRPQPPGPGTCCPTCPGCKMNGQEVSAGRSVRSLEDPCLKCSCVHGRLSCSKRACPVLHCFPSYVNPPKPGECCPSCQGFRKLYSPPHGQCFLGADIHYPGRSFHPDRCTLCRCENGTSYCHRPSCPVLDCPPEDQTIEPGKCCPFCERRTALSTTCNVRGKIYKEDDSWELDQCQSCSCKEGQVMCVVEMCTQSNIPCPPNHKLVKLPGQCCPKCLESDGVCTVFGDPHYRTFDGKFFSFQGSCKYQLAADCLNNTFSIRVTNDARGTKTSSWTKTVSMKLKDTKVNLGDKKRVKINGVRVGVPYDSPVVSVTNTDDYVFVETRIGVKLLWDGSSFLELSVPPNYKGRLCGLCGNFNSNPRDDLITRRGRLATDPDRLGSSWRVGGRRACSRAYETPPPLAPPHCSRYHPRYRERLCKPLRSEIFAVCHKKLNFSLYFRSCLADMCECPSRRCYCESFTAYARECQRLGITLPDWRSATGCHH